MQYSALGVQIKIAISIIALLRLKWQKPDAPRRVSVSSHCFNTSLVLNHPSCANSWFSLQVHWSIAVFCILVIVVMIVLSIYQNPLTAVSGLGLCMVGLPLYGIMKLFTKFSVCSSIDGESIRLTPYYIELIIFQFLLQTRWLCSSKCWCLWCLKLQIPRLLNVGLCWYFLSKKPCECYWLLNAYRDHCLVLIHHLCTTFTYCRIVIINTGRIHDPHARWKMQIYYCLFTKSDKKTTPHSSNTLCIDNQINNEKQNIKWGVFNDPKDKSLYVGEHGAFMHVCS